MYGGGAQKPFALMQDKPSRPPTDDDPLWFPVPFDYPLTPYHPGKALV